MVRLHDKAPNLPWQRKLIADFQPYGIGIQNIDIIIRKDLFRSDFACDNNKSISKHARFLFPVSVLVSAGLLIIITFF